MKTKARLKAALKIWVVIYPSITLFLYLMGALLSSLPLYGRTLILTLALVPWVVFVGVPSVDFLLSRVFAGKDNNNATSQGS